MSSLQPLLPQELTLRATAAIELARRRSRDHKDGFKWFVHNVFSYSFDKFIGGDYINEVCDNMQANLWTMDVTGRDHFKSTRLYAEVMFDVFTAEHDLEGHYFSYNTSLSRYHLKKIKLMILANPMFVHCTDLNAQSDSMIEFSNGRARVTCMPQGLLAFKRGIHAERIYIDDPLKDPENKLAPLIIHRINRIISAEIYAMVKRGGKCRVVGTPQTYDDFFFSKELQTRFVTHILDAMKDEAKRIPLWAEWKSFTELEEIRSIIGERTFNQEYRCKPAYSEDSFISRKRLLALVDPDLINQQRYEGEHDVVGGFDIGKHTHPAHLCLFERWQYEGNYYYKQLLSQWLDNWDYYVQIEHLNSVCELFNVSVLRYDNTRGEFESFAEQGKLAKALKPVGFTLKSKNTMAVTLDTIITGERITFINDQRQTNQMLAVTSDLQAFESAEGHGDSFWSIGMALLEEKQKHYMARTI